MLSSQHSFMIDAGEIKYMRVRVLLPDGTFDKFYHTEMSQQPFANYTLCFIQCEKLLDYIHGIPEGVAGVPRQATDM